LVAGACFVLSNRDDSPAPTPTPGGPVDYKAVASDIGSIVRGDPNKGPTLVRLAWHSSGTYDKMAQRIAGGSEPGTMQFKEELDHGANAGLAETAVAWLEPIKQKYGSGLSYADLYTLGGVSAIKTLGGPTIPWDSGRVDAMDSSQVPPEGRLPAADSGPPGADKADAAEIRSVFGRMGFDDREAVALIGAHALGRCHVEFSGYEGPWTATPTRFNNLYYRFLIGSKWTPRDWTGKFQYEDASKNFMMLPSDLILIQDDKFKPIVDMYAADETLFFTDFSAAFHKLETLGTRNLVPTEWA
jgi:cytochrome c peroxidase